MEDILLRAAGPADLEDLTALWSLSFGDSPDLAAALLTDCGLLEHAALAAVDGRVRSAMFAFDGLRLGGLPASYLYALCTHPDFRGRGLGRRVLDLAAETAFRRGAELVCLRPADSGLARWYGITGFRVLYSAENRPLALSGDGDDLVDITYKDYLAFRRERAVFVPAQVLRAQELFLSRFGGAFFRSAGGVYLCGERDGDMLLIREALGPGERLPAAAAAAARRLGAERILLRRRSPSLRPEDCLMVRSRGALPELSGEIFPFTLE